MRLRGDQINFKMEWSDRPKLLPLWGHCYYVREEEDGKRSVLGMKPTIALSKNEQLGNQQGRRPDDTRVDGRTLWAADSGQQWWEPFQPRIEGGRQGLPQMITKTHLLTSKPQTGRSNYDLGPQG